MGLDVWNGSAWVDAKDVDVWNGSAWTPAKKVKVWNGSSWVLSWVPKVTSATLSLSKSGVQTGETYNVTLTAPGGFPEGAAVTFRFTGYSQTVYPAEGATTATLSGVSHGATGTVAWYADVVTKGGTTTFGPTSQTVQTSEIVVNGGTHSSIQTALDQAYSSGLPVRLTGSFTCSGRIYMPPNVKVNATGAVLNSYHSGQMVVNKGPNNQPGVAGGGYTHAGGWEWDGGSFDARNSSSTAFSIAHCPSATIKNITVWNTKAVGHGIEINSSGGNPITSKPVTAMTDDEFTIKVINATFLGMDATPRASDYDEALHIDYSWDGATHNAANDGTVCNNVLFKDCTVRKERVHSYPVAFGWHHAVNPTEPGGRHGPVAPHRNIKVVGCTFTDVVPQDWAGNERAAIHLRNSARQVLVEGNTLTRCSVGLSMQRVNVDDTYPNTLVTDITIRDNVFDSCLRAEPWITYSGGVNDRWWGLHVTGNRFTGPVNAGLAAYLIYLGYADDLRVTGNKFWGLTGNLDQQGSNRIYGTPGAPGVEVTNMVLSGNTWTADPNGSGAVESNS